MNKTIQTLTTKVKNWYKENKEEIISNTKTMWKTVAFVGTLSVLVAYALSTCEAPTEWEAHQKYLITTEKEGADSTKFYKNILQGNIDRNRSLIGTVANKDIDTIQTYNKEGIFVWGKINYDKKEKIAEEKERLDKNSTTTHKEHSLLGWSEYMSNMKYKKEADFNKIVKVEIYLN